MYKNLQHQKSNLGSVRVLTRDGASLIVTLVVVIPTIVIVSVTVVGIHVLPSQSVALGLEGGDQTVKDHGLQFAEDG
jgi:hypothetical protein